MSSAIQRFLLSGILICAVFVGVTSIPQQTFAQFDCCEYDFGYNDAAFDLGYNDFSYDPGFNDFDFSYSYNEPEYDWGYNDTLYSFDYNDSSLWYDYNDFSYDPTFNDYSSYYEYNDSAFDVAYNDSTFDFDYNDATFPFDYNDPAYNFDYNDPLYDYGYNNAVDPYDVYDVYDVYGSAYDVYDVYDAYVPTYSYTSYSTPIAISAPISIAQPITVANVTPITTSNYHPVQYTFNQPSCSITATPGSITSAQSVSLVWHSNYATSASLSNVGSVSTNGSQSVYPSQTTTYVLTVYGQGGTSNCQTTVYVSQQAPSCTIYASTTNLNSGSPVTLTWNSSNASSASLSNIGSVSTNGSRTVYPNGTMTYTLTVYGYNGQSANCQATVYTSNQGAPSCWITLSPYSSYNNQSTLSWGSTNATSATISPNIGSVSTSGSRTVYPSSGTVYSMTVYGYNGQSANCQTVVNQQPVSCTISASPASIRDGETSYLSWTSVGANSAYLSDGLGSVSANGSLGVRPNTSRTYTLTVQDYQGHTSTCQTYVTVSGSISLTQIPYTGFDFGPIGNALYWLSLLSISAAAAYLLIYWKGGMVAFATGLASSVRRTGGTQPSASEQMEREVRPAVLPVQPVASESSSDRMSFIQPEDGGMPRIVIKRN